MAASRKGMERRLAVWEWRWLRRTLGSTGRRRYETWKMKRQRRVKAWKGRRFCKRWRRRQEEREQISRWLMKRMRGGMWSLA